MEVSVYNIKGEATSKKVTLSEEIFGQEPSNHSIYLDVKQHLANSRQGTHKAKQRSEIARTTKKLKKQKGTGGARAGSMRSPIFRGGGTVFGPTPRDYSFKLNKKLKRRARISALSLKAQEKQILVLEDFNFESPKTKEFANIISNLKLNDKKSLIVLKDNNKAIYLSSRNLQRTKVVTASELSTYDIVNAKSVVFVEASLDALSENYKN